MALEQSDLELLSNFIDQKLAKVEADRPVAPVAEEPSKGQVDAANSTESAPEYYVHLADGSVLQSTDAGSTHMDVDGRSVQVIGRYLSGN